MRSGKAKDKGTEAKIWSEGKQKGDEDPTLTQRQNGLLINSGDNGTGIDIFFSNGNDFNTFFISGPGFLFIAILELFLRKCV